MLIMYVHAGEFAIFEQAVVNKDGKSNRERTHHSEIQVCCYVCVALHRVAVMVDEDFMSFLKWCWCC